MPPQKNLPSLEGDDTNPPLTTPPLRIFWGRKCKICHRNLVQILLYLSGIWRNHTKILHLVYGVKCATKSVEIFKGHILDPKNFDMNSTISPLFR